jgi:hypothetical protein
MAAITGTFKPVKVDIPMARERIQEICKLLEGFDSSENEAVRELGEIHS